MYNHEPPLVILKCFWNRLLFNQRSYGFSHILTALQFNHGIVFAESLFQHQDYFVLTYVIVDCEEKGTVFFTLCMRKIL